MRPAAIVNDEARPVWRKFAPATTTLRIVMLLGPWLVTVILCSLVDPTATLPKATLLRLMAKLEPSAARAGRLATADTITRTASGASVYLIPIDLPVFDPNFKPNANSNRHLGNFIREKSRGGGGE